MTTARNGAGSPPGPRSQRQLRVGEELRHTIARILERGEIRDPDVAGRADHGHRGHGQPGPARTRPYSWCRWAAAMSPPLLAGLKRVAPFLRQAVAARCKLRVVPDFSFQPDTSFDQAQRIERILQSVPRCAAIWTATVSRAADHGRRAIAASRINGWIVLDKPLGMSSAQAVAAVRRADRRRQGRSWRHAGSVGHRRPADRAGRGDQDRLLCDGRRQDLSIYASAGAKAERPTMPRAR